MKFLELNKKRHATKHFTDKPVDPKDVRTAIEIATLAPSAHNSQPWKFVVVREKNAELAKLAYGSNFEQVSSAPVTLPYLQIQTLPNALVRLPELVVLTISQKNNFNTS
ncbi:nitroreductase [Streptococcus pneumoniae]|nr:nitroreductase [Streptococcus pneumoniae]